jgi:glycosyltransferase involved in cell wall biosynthesis
MSPRLKRHQVANRRKKRLFLLFPGPKYDLAHQFGVRLRGLSRHFSGVVLTASPKPLTTKMGSFLLITTTFSNASKTLSTTKYCAAAIAIALKCRRKGNRVDLVVTYDPLKTGVLGLIVARILRSKFITEVNGDYTSWANYSEVKNPTLRRLKRKLYMITERFVLRNADGIKLLYAGQIDHFRPMLGSRVIHAFPDYVNLRPFENLGEEKVILFAGFPLFVKGVDVLIKAFKKVAPMYPDWRLKILGWFPDMTELNACIDGHPKIFHHKPVHHRDMPQHIGKCAIFALPSRTEAMGRVLLEAMAAGKPRIGSDIGGIPTVISDEEDGFLVEPENIDQLANTLGRLMGDPQLRKRLGQNGARRAKREFSFERYVVRTCKLYQQVLSATHERVSDRH